MAIVAATVDKRWKTRRKKLLISSFNDYTVLASRNFIPWHYVAIEKNVNVQISWNM